MRNDVAIYSASSGTAGYYDRSDGRDGGAERQMYLLARTLVERGHRVAQIVFPPREPADIPRRLTLVPRRPRHRDGRLLGILLEAAAVWRALRTADARVVVIRSANPVLGLVALYCRAHRRAFVFSSSNVSDFTLETMDGRWKRALFRFGLRRASAVVVQSDDQRALALEALPGLRKVIHIPSFAEEPQLPPSTAGLERDAFLWFGRSVQEKQPLRYVELARSVAEAQFVMIVTPVQKQLHVLEELRRAARDVPNLVLLDPLPHSRLLGLIARSVAVVNTSTLEGMPNAFLEAWGCGVPVLTLEFDPDHVVASRGLGVAAGGSWDQFVSGAHELWKSRADRELLSQRVRAHVQAAHSLGEVSARWEALLAELGAGAGAP